MHRLIIASTRRDRLNTTIAMRRLAASFALCLFVVLPASAAAVASERWVFDIVDAHTAAISGRATVRAVVDNTASPALAYYSLRFVSKQFPPGGYSVLLGVNGMLRRVDFASEPNGEARLHVSPMLTSPTNASYVAVPAVYVYSGAVLAYRGVLKRSSSDPGPIGGMGMGAIAGQCGVITSSVLQASGPALFENTLDFGADPYDPLDFSRLSTGAQAILGSPTPLTSFALARTFGFEVLRRCEAAQLLKMADEVEYVDEGGKKADMMLQIAGQKVGVTFSRAVKFPFNAPFTIAEAQTQLEGKLGDILRSNENVAPSDRWIKQILHIIAFSQEHAASVRTAYAALDPSLKANTVLFITVTDGADLPLYE